MFQNFLKQRCTLLRILAVWKMIFKTKRGHLCCLWKTFNNFTVYHVLTFCFSFFYEVSKNNNGCISSEILLKLQLLSCGNIHIQVLPLREVLSWKASRNITRSLFGKKEGIHIYCVSIENGGTIAAMSAPANTCPIGRGKSP